MKKIISMLILLIMIGVVSVSGCISYVGQDDNTPITDSNDQNENPLNTEDISSTNSTKTLNEDEVKNVMDNELKTNYTVENTTYNISSFTIKNKQYFNISLEGLNKSSNNTVKGNVTIDATNGEIISINLTEIIKNDTTNKKEKIYSVNEAGDFIDIIYKGKEVSVRENYPYYSPQNDKVYYSQEEEAEDLIKMYDDFN